jgi:hypothetical protein
MNNIDSMTDEEISQAISNIEGLDGMTGNERLSAIGLLNEFDKIKKYNKPRARKILEMLHFDKPSIDRIVRKKFLGIF